MAVLIGPVAKLRVVSWQFCRKLRHSSDALGTTYMYSAIENDTQQPKDEPGNRYLSALDNICISLDCVNGVVDYLSRNTRRLKMPFDTAIRSALRDQSPAFGFWLTLNNTAAAKTVLRSTKTGPSGGFSWVLVDAEHGLITDRDYYELTNAIASEGASPIIRVPWGEEWMIKRALDAGAHGVMTPMCHSEEDAVRIVKYSKYPPLGSRGYGPMFAPHAIPGVEPGEHHDVGADEALIVAVQIESRSGVENCEKIAQVDGLDVLFIGPFDLAKQMGVTRGGGEHEAAIQRILKAAKSAGKTAAIFCTDGNDAQNRVQQGFDMVSVITDVGVLGEGMNRHLAAAAGVNHSQNPRKGY